MSDDTPVNLKHLWSQIAGDASLGESKARCECGWESEGEESYDDSQAAFEKHQQKARK